MCANPRLCTLLVSILLVVGCSGGDEGTAPAEPVASEQAGTQTAPQPTPAAVEVDVAGLIDSAVMGQADRWTIAREIAKGGPATVTRLLQELQASDSRRPFVAATALELLGPAVVEAVVPLTTVATDESQPYIIRYQASRAVKKIAPDQYKATLKKQHDAIQMKKDIEPADSIMPQDPPLSMIACMQGRGGGRGPFVVLRKAISAAKAYEAGLFLQYANNESISAEDWTGFFERARMILAFCEFHKEKSLEPGAPVKVRLSSPFASTTDSADVRPANRAVLLRKSSGDRRVKSVELRTTDNGARLSLETVMELMEMAGGSGSTGTPALPEEAFMAMVRTLERGNDQEALSMYTRPPKKAGSDFFPNLRQKYTGYHYVIQQSSYDSVDRTHVLKLGRFHRGLPVGPVRVILEKQGPDWKIKPWHQGASDDVY